MNLADLREVVRVKTGYPERGTTGTTRLNKAINYALRHAWGEMPEVLLKQQHRLRLETPISNTANIHFADRFTWYLPTSVSPILTTDGTLSARNFEVQGTDGNWYQFRIREVRRVPFQLVSGGPNVTRDLIIVDNFRIGVFRL